MRHLAEEGTRLARRLRRDEFQHHRQVVRQLARRQKETGLLVGLGQVDHGRPPVARIAMHVLEQMQRGGVAAVEQFDVGALRFQRSAAFERANQRIQLATAADG